MRSFNASARFTATILFAFSSAVVVVLPLLLLIALDLDWTAALRDAGLSTVPEAGLVSTAGIALMLFGAIASAAAWSVSRLPALAGLALFCSAFAIDDALMLHERLEKFEAISYVAYGLLFAWIWRQFALIHDRALLWPLLLILFAFAGSAIVDQVSQMLAQLSTRPLHHRVQALLYAMEDVPKTMGILCLVVVAVNEALDAQERSAARVEAAE